MNNTQTDDEFFIGWERDVPPHQRRFLYHRLIGIFVFVFSLGLLMPFMQTRYEPSFYKYISKNRFEGVFVADPVPSLLVTRPGTIQNGMLNESQYLLVNPNKYGFSVERAKELDGKYVRMNGAVIFNRSKTMIEALPKSIEVIGSDSDSVSIELKELGKYKLTGIIADSKSYYGALNPGFGKPSRACAVRSIANGIPPVLLIQDERGESQELIVLGDDFDVIGPSILDWVGVPLRLTGTVYSWGEKFVITTSEPFIEVIDN